MKQKTVLYFCMILIGFSIGIFGCSFSNSGVIVNSDGSSYWEKEGFGLLEWDKHITQSCSGTRYLNVTSFLASQDLDVCISTDRVLNNNKGVWLWKNISHPAYVKEWINISVCNDFNGTGCVEDGYFQNVQIDDEWFFDWYDTKDKFSHLSHGGKEYYCVKDVYFQQNKKYEVKLDFGFPIQRLRGGFGCDEKFGLVAKRSVDSIADVLASGNYIELDPFANASYTYCRELSDTDGGNLLNVGEAVYADLSMLGYDKEEMKSLTVYDGDCNNGTANQVSNDFLKLNFSWIALASSGTGTHAVYYDNISAVAGGYDADLFAFADPFEQYNATDGTSLIVGYDYYRTDANSDIEMVIGSCAVGNKCATMGETASPSLVWGQYTMTGQTSGTDVITGGNATLVMNLNFSLLTDTSYMGQVSHDSADSSGPTMRTTDATSITTYNLVPDVIDSGADWTRNVWGNFKHTWDVTNDRQWGWWHEFAGSWEYVTIRTTADTADRISFHTQTHPLNLLTFDEIFVSNKTELFQYNISSNANAVGELGGLEVGAEQIGNTGPVWSAIADIEKDEGFANFTLDLSDNITDAEDGDGDLQISYNLNISDWIVEMDNSTDILTVSAFTPNASGVVNVSLTLVDTGGLEDFESFDLIINQVNDAPWWNETANTTYVYDEDFGADFPIWDESGLNNTYQDVEENHLPYNCSISVNETITITNVRYNGSVIADSVANMSGGVELTVNCSDSGWLSTITSFVITINPVNEHPVWDAVLENYTFTEDDGQALSRNLDLYSSDVEDDLIPVNLTYSITETGASIVDCSFPTPGNLYCVNQNTNLSGDNLVNISALDSDGATESIWFNMSVMPVNDAPWWDVVANNTLTLFYNSLNQNVSVGFADYFQDIEDPNNPVLSILSDNSSDFNCSIQTGDLICDTDSVGGNVIINIQGDDSEGSSAYMSFEILINTPPTLPTVRSPEDHALNDTAQIRLSCSGSTDVDMDTVYHDYYADTNSDVLTNSTNQICLNVDEECLWNNTDANRRVYWKCYANDTSDNSSASSIRSIRTETWDVIDVNLSAPSAVVHSDVMNFDVNISWNEIRFTGVDATVNVSGYNYTATKTAYDNYTHFTVDVVYNNSLWADSPLGYLWNFTLSYKNGTLYENSSSYGGTINTFDIHLYNCSATNESILFNITGFHEDDVDLLAVDIDAKIDVWTEDKDFAKTFTFEWNDTQPVNVSNFSKSHYVCLSYNTSVLVDAYFLYSSPGGFTQRYYISNLVYQNNTNNEVHLYNRDYTSGISTLKGTTRYTSNYNYFPNIIAKLQRYYVSEDVWRTVQMDKSGDFGLVHFNIKEVEKDYKFIFQDEDNHVLKTTESMKFKCDPDTSICELTFLMDPWTGAVGIGDLQVSHTFDNDTGLITVNWNDPTGITSEVRILVTKENMGGSVEICNSASSGSAGSYSCNASLYTGQLLLKVLSTASPESPVYMKWIEKFGGRLSDLIGDDDSAWWVFGVSLTLTLGGATVSPVAGIIAFVVSLVALFSLEMASFITISFITLAVVLGLAIGVKVRS